MKNLVYVILVVIMACTVVVSCGHKASESESYLQRLDSILGNAQEYEIQKKRNMSDLTHKFMRATDPMDQYFQASQLSDEYMVFCTDSAMKYID